MTTDQLLACGLSARAVTTRVAKGLLHRIHRGVYAVGHDNLVPQGRFLAAVRACGSGALLSHRSAAMHWGLIGYEEREIEVTVASSAGRSVPGLALHRSTSLAPEDRRLREGVPVTSPERTVVDCAAVVGPKGLRRLVREAQSRRLVSLPGLLHTLDRLGRPRGSAALRRIVATGPAPTRSELEDVVLDLMLKGGLAHPDVNKPLDIDGRKVVPDFRWPAERLVVEADGAAWHEHRVAREDDAERQALLEAAGERVVRVTWEQAVRRAAETLARFGAAGAPRVSTSLR